MIACKFLKFIDLFGYTIGFTYDNTDRFKSTIGGLLTIAYFVVIIVTLILILTNRELKTKFDVEYKPESLFEMQGFPVIVFPHAKSISLEVLRNESTTFVRNYDSISNLATYCDYNSKFNDLVKTFKEETDNAVKYCSCLSTNYTNVVKYMDNFINYTLVNPYVTYDMTIFLKAIHLDGSKEKGYGVNFVFPNVKMNNLVSSYLNIYKNNNEDSEESRNESKVDQEFEYYHFQLENNKNLYWKIYFNTIKFYKEDNSILNWSKSKTIIRSFLYVSDIKLIYKKELNPVPGVNVSKGKILITNSGITQHVIIYREGNIIDIISKLGGILKMLTLLNIFVITFHKCLFKRNLNNYQNMISELNSNSICHLEKIKKEDLQKENEIYMNNTSNSNSKLNNNKDIFNLKAKSINNVNKTMIDQNTINFIKSNSGPVNLNTNNNFGELINYDNKINSKNDLNDKLLLTHNNSKGIESFIFRKTSNNLKDNSENSQDIDIQDYLDVFNNISLSNELVETIKYLEITRHLWDTDNDSSKKLVMKTFIAKLVKLLIN